MATNRLQINFARTPGTFIEDVAVNTLHLQTTAGALLSGAQMIAVETRWKTFWTSIAGQISGYCLPLDFRWYDQQIWPALSPLVRLQATGSASGTAGGNALPPQCAISCTLSTAHRKRWGRFYLPAPAASALTTTTGRVLTAVVDIIGNALDVFASGLSTDGTPLVVWSPKGGAGPPAFAAGDVEVVNSVRVDDIVDIIRSRRWQASPYRKVNAVP